MLEHRRRVGMHTLDADDEPAFQGLLRAVYGETYSYRFLYEPGGMASLLEGGKATLWGDFDERGELVGHTGIFYKGLASDYAESGMSFRRPKALPTTSDERAFSRILDAAAERVTYLHQSTTTWHPLAQRFAERHMRATPTGLVLEYVEPHERIVGLPPAQRPMDAVTMTTCLRAGETSETACIPRGPFASWLTERFAALGVRTKLATEVPRAAQGFRETDRVDWIGLVRSTVVEGDDPMSAREPPCARTTLVHVPTDRRVMTVHGLMEHGFLPVGVRPRSGAPHEIVLQKLSAAARQRALLSIESASFTPAARSVARSWSTLCADHT